MQSRIKIRIAEDKDFSESTVQLLKQFADVELRSCTQEELPAIFEQVDVFWFRLGFKINSELFTEKSRVKVLATPVTGIDHIDEDFCHSKGIKIVCLRGETDFLKQVRATAEHTIGLTLALMRHVVPAVNSVKEGYWDRDIFRGRELYGKTVGIIGLGRLGKIVAGYFNAFGCTVLAYDNASNIVYDSFVEKMSTLSELTLRSDIISIHVNYNSSNHLLFGKDFFENIRPHSFLINTSRGGLVDETVLLEYLRVGKIAGVALDVIQNEFGFSPTNPLVEYAIANDNLILTPHIGGNTYESFQKTEFFIADKIKSHFKGTNEL